MTKQLLLREPVELTLREAWEKYYRDPSAQCRQTRQSVECTLCHWERCTENPPIGQITNLITQPFRQRYLSWPNPHKTMRATSAAVKRDGPQRRVFQLLSLDPHELSQLDLSEAVARVTAHVDLLGESDDPLLDLLRPKPATYNRVQRELQAVFNRLGPASYGNPDGLGLIATPPRLLTIDEPEPEPIVADPAQVSAMFAECENCTWPALSDTGIRPPDLWRAVLVLVYNIALRKGDLLSIELARVNRVDRTLQVRQGKTEKYRVYPLNQTVMAWLAPIFGPPRQRLFPFPRNDGYFYEEWRAIQRRAGITVDRAEGSERHDVYGLHELRKTSLTQHYLADPSGASAQAMGAHASMLTTMKHYIAAKAKDGVLRRAADSLEQPSAFLERGGPPPRNDGPTFPQGWGLVG